MRTSSRIISFLLCLSFVLQLCACGKSADAGAQTQTGAAEETAPQMDFSHLYEEDGNPKEDSELRGFLSEYLERLKADPYDKEARIGAVRCQALVGDWLGVEAGVTMLTTLYPESPELVDALSALGQEYYDRQALEMAGRIGYQAFLDACVPEETGAASEITFSLEEGDYDAPMQLELESKSGREITVTFTNDRTGYDETFRYVTPLTLFLGENRITAYETDENGEQSSPVEKVFTCSYAPTEVEFADEGVEKIVRVSLAMDGSTPVYDWQCAGIGRLSSDEEGTIGLPMDVTVRSLEDLRYFPNLKELQLSRQHSVADWSPVWECAGLKRLFLTYTTVGSIEGVEKLEGLESLWLVDSNTSDLAPLTGLNNLRLLMLEGLQLKDLSPVYSLSSLRSVTLQNTRGTKIDVSRLPEGISYLGITPDTIEDWNALLDRKNLTTLFLGFESNGTDYEVLAQMTWLTSLSLEFFSGPSVMDLSFLDNLTDLTYLLIGQADDKTQMDHLTRLTGLKDLFLRSSKIGYDPECVKTLREALPDCDVYFD